MRGRVVFQYDVATVIRVLFEAGILTAHYVEERRSEVTLGRVAVVQET
jgi:hypothetical protein